MEQSDTLLTIAEISVALAGFATLASVIGRRQDDASPGLDALRLQVMLEVTLQTAAFALLPLPFMDAISDPAIWRLASALWVVSAAGTAAYGIHRGRSRADVWGNRWLTISTFSLLAVGLIVSASNVVGLGGPRAFSLYLGSLVTSLGSSGLLFMAVVGSVLRGHRQ